MPEADLPLQKTATETLSCLCLGAAETKAARERLMVPCVNRLNCDDPWIGREAVREGFAVCCASKMYREIWENGIQFHLQLL